MTHGTVAAVFLLIAAIARAEHLPIRIYTTADGLASTNVNCLLRDSQGVLWFCTSEGLSRFDGYTFTNYTFSGGPTPREEIGRTAVDFLETRDGELWALAPHALCRFNKLPGARNPLSECYQSPTLLDSSLTQIAEAPDGSIWFLQTRALFRFIRNGRHFEPVDLGHAGLWTSLMQDADGTLWIGGEKALAHRFQDGRVDYFGEADGIPVNAYHYFRVSTMRRDREHRLWIATWQGLCLMAPDPRPGAPAVEHVYTTQDGLPGNVVFDVFQAHDGKLWAAGENGLSEWDPSGGAWGRFRRYPARRTPYQYRNDVPDGMNLVEDSSGNLWMSGPMRVATHGFISYGKLDGLDSNEIKAVFEDRDGQLIAISADPRPRHLNVFDGEIFHPILPRLPASIPYFTWGQSQIHFQDHAGVWWVAAEGGVCRYPKVRRVEDLANTLPEKVYTKRDGLPGTDIFRLFEDSRRDVWISPIGSDLSRWSRATDRIEVFRLMDKDLALGAPVAFAEDHAGNIWMSFFQRDLARYRNGRFGLFTKADGLPVGPLPALFVDHVGRLWIATRGQGLARVDDPSAEHPKFRFYGIEEGLSSNEISCMVEDQWGRIYAGSPHGIDQLDPATGRVRHYGESAGLLTPGRLAAAYRDRQGNLWFAGDTLAKFVPEPPEAAKLSPPPIRVTRIRAHGEPYPVSELGQRRVDGIRLPSTENAIRIEFASLNFDVAENIRFQYKLEGSRQDWSAPNESRMVDYASLSSGPYRFLVRAVNAEGMVSETPASVSFVILPPWWRRWWFVGLTAATLSLLILGGHRYRVRQVLELERVRTRIATDLHDDVGSSLTQIAILSEVARRNGRSHHDGAEPLERIADLSRGLLDSMSDIVWSINPQRDHLSDLEHRMRRFASDMFAPRDVDFELEVPKRSEDVPLHAEVRRQVFLIFKECVHNALRHSGCRRMRVALEYRGHHLLLRLSDDGQGFAASGIENGHGLVSMRQRAAGIGGELRIISQPGNGTTVTLQVPLLGKQPRVQKST